MNDAIKIKPLPEESIEDFFVYLNDHISDNGRNATPLFLPISKNDLSIPPELKDSFSNGQSISINELGWRRIFIALNDTNEIIGHIDLKSHNQRYTNHRAILGMGVHRDHRKKGLGHLLITSIVDWVKKESEIEQIDLWVLSANHPAIRLYNKLGFKEIGEVVDMFRIDGHSHSYTMMSKKITKG